MVWKEYNVTRVEYRAMLIDNVIPAIMDNWPRGTLHNTIRLQQDNAPLHIKPDDPDWLAAVARSGLHLEIYNQPPNSPDTNINDLAFFASIQSLQHKIGSGNNKGSLIRSVFEAYDTYPWKNLRDAFLTLQGCLNCIIEEHGGNDYTIPHMDKAELENLGLLPLNLKVTAASAQFPDYFFTQNEV